MGHRARLVAQGAAIGLVALLFFLLAWSLLHDEGGDLLNRANRGDRPTAPDFTLERLDRDGRLQLSSLRGKVVVLNAWASWCGPCRQELPTFQRLADSGRVPVLGVVTEDRRDAAAWLGDELKVSLPSVYDRAGDLKAAVGENLLPLTLFVGADGRAVVYRDVALTDQTLAQLIQQHFGRV